MPLYTASPFKPMPKLLVQGTPEYLFGNWNANTGPTQGIVLQSLGLGTTGELVVKILAGNIPVVDSLITVVGVSASANFNVTNAILTAVDKYPHGNNPDNGVYALSYAISNTLSPIQADSGQFIIPQPEIGEALLAVSDSPVSSAPVTSAVAGPDNTGKSLSVTVKLPANTTAHPSDLTGVTVVLQGANLDLNSEYNTIATVASSVSAGSTTDWQSGQGDTATGTLAAGSVLMPNFRHYRLQVTGATSAGGGGGYIIGKILS